MKFQLMSDLHFEFQRDGGKEFVEKSNVLDVDALVIAGDLHPIESAEELFTRLDRFCAKWPKVIYVPGNHEYYGQRPAAVRGRLLEVQKQLNNLSILDSAVIEIKGVRIIGGTLWFKDDPFNKYCAKVFGFNDFHWIQNFEPWVYEESRKFKGLLHKSLVPGSVVITHHAPTDLSIHPRFKGDELNRFYVNDCSKEILNKKPALWMHGHMHDALDYTVGVTRVICNPYGLPGQSTGYEEKIIEPPQGIEP